MRRFGTVALAFDKWEPRVVSKTKPFVFLHGLFGSRVNNRSAAKNIARALQTPVYCVDMRNHGESPHSEVHNYSAMAADVARFINEHNLESPTVIGHSMGAKAAMELALTQPDLVGKLIPVDNAPISLKLSSDFGHYIHGMMLVDQAQCIHQADMYKILSPHCPELPIMQFLLSNFKKDKDGVYRCRIPLQTLAKSLGYVSDFETHQTRFCKPTLFIRGTKSNFVPDESLPIIGQLFPAFTIRDIDSGHWVISEKPKEFVDEVVRFCEEDL